MDYMPSHLICQQENNESLKKIYRAASHLVLIFLLTHWTSTCRMAAMNDELMTSSQAAELAGTTRQNILVWLKAGHLTAVHVLRGGQRRPLYLFARQAVLTARDTTARPGALRSAKPAIAETPATDAHPQPEETKES
jgi:hypothetical protein